MSSHDIQHHVILLLGYLFTFYGEKVQVVSLIHLILIILYDTSLTSFFLLLMDRLVHHSLLKFFYLWVFSFF